MLEWAWPWVAALLPLPWLLRWMLPAAADRGGIALRLPFADEARAIANSASSSRFATLPVLAMLAWVLLCIAAARPQWVGEAQDQPRSGRDLLLAVDVSGSMQAEDMRIGGRPVDRLTAVQVVAGDFLRRRAGDRVGLLLFGQQAYLMTPLTFDLKHVDYQLQSSVIGLAGRETAMGDAIGLAVKRLRETKSKQRVLILLTDGVNTAGALNPRKASELAVAEKVRVYTVGVGGDGRQSGMLGMMFAQPEEIDEATLQEVAQRTGGRYFRARNTAELAGIYAEIERLEPSIQTGERLRPRSELFVWPLAASLLMAAFGLLGRLVAAQVAGARFRPSRAQ
ncbi:MAG: vWA domain-containing protein [Pseudomarimonas sp.]